MNGFLVAFLIVFVILLIAGAGTAIYFIVGSADELPLATASETTPVGVGTNTAISNGAPVTSDELADTADTNGATLIFANEAERQVFLESLSPKRAATTGSLADYMFVQGADLNGYDLANRTDLGGKPEELATACNATTGCVGFNHQGYLKKKVATASRLDRYMDWASDPARGFYYRSTATPISRSVTTTAPALDGWNFAQGLDMMSYDLPARRDLAGKPAELAAACRATPGCVGFNTLGYLKSKVFASPYMWAIKRDDGAQGIYYLATAIEEPFIMLYTNTSGTADASTVTMGVGDGTLSGSVQYIQIPRNVVVVMKNANGQRINLLGPIRGNIAAWAGANIEVLKVADSE
jgi:hypothetical protein